MKEINSDNNISFKYTGYFIIVVLLFPLVSMLVYSLFNTDWMTKNPILYLLIYILLASLFLTRLFILRGSYKYANDLILAVSAGWIGISYIATGQKLFDEPPSLDLVKEHPFLFYTIAFKFILVTSSLVTKAAITFIEFIRAWRKEEKDFTGISAWVRIKLIFKKPRAIKKT